MKDKRHLAGFSIAAPWRYDAVRVPDRRPGPKKWCRCCSRVHPSKQPCDLIPITRELRPGVFADCWVHRSAAEEWLARTEEQAA